MGYDRGDSFPFDFEVHLVQNRKENCYHDHIPFDLKGNGMLVFSVHVSSSNALSAYAGEDIKESFAQIIP